MTDSFSPAALQQRLGGRNLYLVGMMGSGKSASGPHLAKELGYGFVDSDKVIEQVCGESIPIIFEKEGEKGFRTVENQVLNTIGQHHSLVVATGGGLVTQSENWGVLHQGIVIWLDLAIDQLCLRLQSDPGDRPLLKTKNPRSVLEKLLNEREKFYLEADLHLKINNESSDEVTQKILQALPAILSEPEGLNGQQTTAISKRV